MLENEGTEVKRTAVVHDPGVIKIGLIKIRLLAYLSKMKGNPRTTPLTAPPPFDIFISGLGALLGIAAVAFLSLVHGLPMLVASFGASAILVYGVPDAPLSQPRNVFFGHAVSATVGVLTYSFFGLSWWSAALGVSLALVMMLVTKTTHPPGGATALVAILNQAHPIFILTPVAAGAVILVLVGIIVNNLSPNRSYPRYWI